MTLILRQKKVYIFQIRIHEGCFFHIILYHFVFFKHKFVLSKVAANKE